MEERREAKGREKGRWMISGGMEGSKGEEVDERRGINRRESDVDDKWKRGGRRGDR